MRSALAIETPEGLTFTFRLASPIARALAWAVDALLLLAAGEAIGRAVAVFGVVSPDLALAISTLAFFAFSTAYAIVLEWYWRGQTIGKRLLGLRVLDAQGLRLRFPQVVVRNLLRGVDMLPLAYLVGGAAALLTEKAQRLGDLAANTVVIREASRARPDLAQIAPAKYNSLPAYPHMAARLRSRVGPEAAAIAVRALLDRDRYEPAARLTLFRNLAEYFRGLVRYPEEALEGLTDEQYVRSVVRVLYSGRG